MMKTILLLNICLFISLPVFSQITDDFSDGDFTNNPEWLGQTEKFAVQNETLQLLDENAGSSNTAYLYTPAPTSTNELTTWEFLVRLEFAPSGSNFARVYLNASAATLDGSLNGYYLQVGGISGTDDALELKRQDGDVATVLLTGTTGAVGNDPAQARVQITRSTAGEWTLHADYSGGSNYQLEGSVTDNTYEMGGFFGLYCNYSSTRSDAFFLDDVLITPLFEDTTPPTLSEVQIQDASTLLVSFDEPLSSGSAENPSNYNIDNGIGTPAAATLVAGNPAQVRLSLASPMENTQDYTLTINNIQDTEGNTSTGQSLTFTFFDIQPVAFQDIIISELMADPNPSAGLPDGEYIELYNLSDKVIDVSTLFFSSGSSPAALPSYLLLPGSYVGIVSESLMGAYGGEGPLLGIPSFPALTNGGDDLSLTNADGETIFELSYSDSWYNNPERENGGYSLEIVQLEGPYDCAGNWSASLNEQGGTPGLPNSWLGLDADQDAPFVSAAFADNELEIFVQYSEQMDLSSISDPANYSLSNGISIESVNYQGDDQVLLIVSDMLQTSVVYGLTISGSVTDCFGNALSTENLSIVLTEEAAAQEIIINEILFNPVSGSVDFVELLNRSEKAINLNGLLIENEAKESGDTLAELTEDYVLLPGSYAVITEDPNEILNQFTVLQPDALIEENLPTLEDKNGNVTIRLNGITLDSFDYDEQYHYPLLDSKEGVSLERLSPDANTQDAGNWHSAAASAGFGTPTYENSQLIEAPGIIDEAVSLPYTTFSPDGDGFQDVLLINYQLDAPGYTLNMRIFDSQGREIRQLVNNETLSISGTYQWDGTNGEPARARIGIYVLWIELFQPDGTIERDKIPFVLAGQLD
jgi:hypothetical protein